MTAGPTARISQLLAENRDPAPEPRTPASGDTCVIEGCADDTRRGTLQGGAPMLCKGLGMIGEPCIAVWLVDPPEEREHYLDFVDDQRG